MTAPLVVGIHVWLWQFDYLLVEAKTFFLICLGEFLPEEWDVEFYGQQDFLLYLHPKMADTDG